MLTCADFSKLKIDCCHSCHEEADMGIDALIEIQVNWGGKDVEALVCCKIANHFEGLAS